MWIKIAKLGRRSVTNIQSFRYQLARHSSCHAPASRTNSTLSYLHHPGTQPLQYASLGAVLAQAAHAHYAQVALTSHYEDVTYTYEELMTKADAVGCALLERGVTRGDRLALWSHNSAAYLLLLVATVRVGLIPVAINPAYEQQELAYCLRKSGAKALMIGDRVDRRDYYAVLQQLLPGLAASAPGLLDCHELPELKTVITAGKETLPGTVTLDSLMLEGSSRSRVEADRFCAEVQPEDGCIIHFTSGTTGVPKAALDSHFGVVNQAYLTGRRLLLDQQRQTVCLQTPMFHALASVITVLSALRHGATIAIAGPHYNVDHTAETIARDKCTVITGTPTMFVDLVARGGGGGVARGLRVALTAGAPCSPSLFTDIRDKLQVESVKSLYGMTETTAGVFMSLPGDSEELTTTTVGYLQDHLQVKVVDSKDRTVPFGARGELLVRGYSVTPGYWADPDKTRQAIDQHGWLRTGDEFILSPDGYGRIVGRQKDIIVRGGENIAPKEIEDLLNTHPDILESQVIGVPDHRLGEELMAVLRCSRAVSQAELRAHLSGRLASYKVPRIVRVVEDFPKTASGKIQKYRLKQMVESGEL